jgi:S1-C subfamily serine protease
MINENTTNHEQKVEVRVDKVKLELDSASESKPGKDFWDKLGATSTLLSGILVGLIGIYATSIYNARQLESQRLQQKREISVRRVETVEKFFVHLASQNQSVRGAALDTIAALGDEELATNLAKHFGGEGSRSTLARLSQSSDPTIARRAELALNELFRTLQKSVATFYSSNQGISTAFFVSSDGLAVVPSFALGDSDSTYFVQLASSKERFPATVLKKNEENWLALVKVEVPGSTVPINKSQTTPRIGEQVAAVGFSGGFEWLSIVGRILGESKEGQRTVILSDLQLSPGMAGAPVVNMAGELVGIAVASDRERSISHLILPDILWQFVDSSI